MLLLLARLPLGRDRWKNPTYYQPNTSIWKKKLLRIQRYTFFHSFICCKTMKDERQYIIHQVTIKFK